MSLACLCFLSLLFHYANSQFFPTDPNLLNNGQPAFRPPLGGFPSNVQQSQVSSDGILRVPPLFGRGQSSVMTIGNFRRRTFTSRFLAPQVAPTFNGVQDSQVLPAANGILSTGPPSSDRLLQRNSPQDSSIMQMSPERHEVVSSIFPPAQLVNTFQPQVNNNFASAPQEQLENNVVPAQSSSRNDWHIQQSFPVSPNQNEFGRLHDEPQPMPQSSFSGDSRPMQTGRALNGIDQQKSLDFGRPDLVQSSPEATNQFRPDPWLISIPNIRQKSAPLAFQPVRLSQVFPMIQQQNSFQQLNSFQNDK